MTIYPHGVRVRPNTTRPHIPVVRYFLASIVGVTMTMSQTVTSAGGYSSSLASGPKLHSDPSDTVAHPNYVFFVSEVTQTSAILTAVIPATGSPLTVTIEWGNSEFRSSSTETWIADPDTGITVIQQLTGLNPQSLYYPKLSVSDSGNAIVISDALRFSTRPRGTYGGTIFPLSVGDIDGIRTNSVWVGVHPGATNCLDAFLGEWELPPRPPPGLVDVRLLSPADSLMCYGEGVYDDYRPYYDSSQYDLFHLYFQTRNSGYPVKLSWPDLSQWFSGSIRLVDPYGGTFVDVDMMAESSFVIDTPELPDLMIVSGRGGDSDGQFSATTGPARYVEQTSADLGGIIHTGIDAGKIWFEWGLTESYSDMTVPREIAASFGYLKHTERIADLLPGTEYHFRIVGETPAGVRYGSDQAFKTVLDDDSLSMISHVTFRMGSESRTLYFGVHGGATACIDDSLGERMPEDDGSVGARFLNPDRDGPPCDGTGRALDLRAYYSESQIDTYRIALGEASGPFVGSWPDVEQDYTGPVVLHYYDEHNLVMSLDMAGSGTTLLPQGTSIEITAAGPILQNRRPSVLGSSVGFNPDHSVSLLGRVNPHGFETSYWAEYGATTEVTRVTSTRALSGETVGVPTEPFVLTDLNSNTIYYYRICASSSRGTARGTIFRFTTGAAFDPDTTEDSGPVPLVPNLYQNYPNPFNPSTTIEYDVPLSGLVVLRIIDIAGREIARPVNGVQSAGKYSVEWEPGDLATGIYLCSMTAPGYRAVKKMLHIR